MQSSFRSPFLLAAAVLVIVGASTACTGLDRRAMEEQMTGKLNDLLPGGRIYPNDLGVNREMSVRGVYLENPELLVEDAHGRVTALDRLSLKPLWFYAGLPEPLEFAPTMTAATIVMISDGKFFEVDRRFGNETNRNVQLHFVASAGAAATASTAYVPTLAAPEGNPTLITVNLLTGIEGWRLATRGTITAPPVIGGSATRPVLYFVTDRGGVFAFPADSATGAAPDPSWMTRTHGRNLHSPVLYGDVLLVGSDQGDLWSLSRVTGTVNWSLKSGEAVIGQPWASGDQVYFSNREGFHAVDATNGNVLWTLPAVAKFIVRRPEAVIVRTRDGVVHALDHETGEVVNSVEFPGGVAFPANMMDDTLYAVTRGGLVFAVDTGIR